MRVSRLAPTFPAQRFISILHHSFAFAPLLALLALQILSLVGALIIRHWPQPMFDDPKFISTHPLYQILFFVIMVLFLWSATGLFMFPLLTLLQRRAYPRLWTLFLIALFVVGWLVLRADPGNRILWYMD